MKHAGAMSGRRGPGSPVHSVPGSCPASRSWPASATWQPATFSPRPPAWPSASLPPATALLPTTGSLTTAAAAVSFKRPSRRRGEGSPASRHPWRGFTPPQRHPPSRLHLTVLQPQSPAPAVLGLCYSFLLALDFATDRLKHRARLERERKVRHVPLSLCLCLVRRRQETRGQLSGGPRQG